jgi:CheY-like chemotaxis protein
MRTLITAMLQEIGLQKIYRANDGAEALQELNAGNIDLVITDFVMENMNGVELVRQIRRNQGSISPFIPVIMVTSDSSRKAVLQARDAGVTEFLAKPFSIAGLMQRIEACIEQPRPFIRTKSYAGPCRRRQRLSEFAGVNRRGRTEDEIAAMVGNLAGVGGTEAQNVDFSGIAASVGGALASNRTEL